MQHPCNTNPFIQKDVKAKVYELPKEIKANKQSVSSISILTKNKLATNKPPKKPTSESNGDDKKRKPDEKV